MKKLYILWLRQLKKYARSKSRMIGSLGQPILYLIAMGYGFGSVFSKAGQGDYISFLVPGIISMTILFTAIFSGIEIIWDRQFGFLKEMLVAPMSRFSIMLGRTLGGATVATIQAVLVCVISFIFGFSIPGPFTALAALVIMFLIATLFTALGTMIASLLEDMQGFQLIMNFLIMPIFFLSGALFPLEGLPKVLSMVATLDPLSYCVDALRAVLIGSSYYGLTTDMTVIIALTVAFMWLGSHFFKRIEI